MVFLFVRVIRVETQRGDLKKENLSAEGFVIFLKTAAELTYLLTKRKEFIAFEVEFSGLM